VALLATILCKVWSNFATKLISMIRDPKVWGSAFVSSAINAIQRNRWPIHTMMSRCTGRRGVAGGIWGSGGDSRGLSRTYEGNWVSWRHITAFLHYTAHTDIDVMQHIVHIRTNILTHITTHWAQVLTSQPK